MRISGFHVDGFGALADFGIEDLSPGLVIVSGPNEAGKSTLLDFLTAMLFGFPSRRDNPRFRAPVRGGRHGGQLSLSDGDRSGDNRQWRIERYASPHRHLNIRGPDGTSASEEDLRRALGGADEALFRAVFAVDLTELGSADSVSRDDVRELLFSASIVGQRRSAARAMGNLQRQRLELARLRQGDAPANRLLADLESVRHDLTEASREAAGLSSMQVGLSRLEDEIAQAREQCDRYDRRTRDLDLLVRLWDVLERKRAAEQRIAGWDEPEPFAAWLEGHAPELQSLRSTCSGHLAHVGQLAELYNQRAGIEQSIQAAMGSLGPAWSRDSIRTSEGWIGLADEGRGFRASLGDCEASWRMAQALAEEADASPELTGLADLASGSATICEPTPAADSESKTKLVSELRRNLAEQRRLTAEKRAGERQSGAAAGALWNTSSASIALVAFAIGGLAVVAALAPGAPALRVACAVLAAAGCVLLALAIPARRRYLVTGHGQDADMEAASDRVARRVSELATTLGLPVTPSDSDVETAAESIEAERVLERSLEDDRRRRIEALRRHRAAHESLARAWEVLAAERVAFADWKVAHGLAPALSPDGVLESLAALQVAWTHLAALQRVDDKIQQLHAEVDEFEGRLGRLAADLGELGEQGESLFVDPMGTLEHLCAELADVVDQQTTRDSLLRVVEDAGAELGRSFGLGPHALRLQTELETGEVLAWNEEQAGLTPARRQARERLEQFVRAHQDASNQLREVVGSGRIPELEQARLALEQDLDKVLKSWAVLGLARLLLERTLRRHEQEHQPAVLARAGERFAKVTEGRYQCLLPSVGDESGNEAIRVLSASGAELEASDLSRGSVEQLYLCLRLGLAETFAERAKALPLILDDVLVNFDPGRAVSVAEALAETAERHQVLLLTCHPHLEQLMCSVAPNAQVVHLERI
jgi:uncharacterized protein YhaN